MANGNSNSIQKILIPILTFLLGLTAALGFSQLTLGNAVARHEVEIANLKETDKALAELMKEVIKKIPDARVEIR